MAFSAVGIRVRLFVFALVWVYQCTSQFLASCSALAARQTSGGPRGQPASMLCSMDWRLTNGWPWFWLCLAWLQETCLVCDFVFFLCVGLLFSFLSFAWCPQMLKSIITPTLSFVAAPWVSRYFSRNTVFIDWKCVHSPAEFCLPFGFCFSLGCFYCFLPRICFLDWAEVLVGSSVVVPFLLFFLSFFRVCHVYSFCSFFHFFSFFLFCLCSEFILVEALFVLFACFVDFPFFFWRVSSEGFSPLFSFLHWVPACQNVFLILWSVWIFLVQLARTEVSSEDCSFHLPRIDLGRAGWCVTDTLSKRFTSVGVSTG